MDNSKEKDENGEEKCEQATQQGSSKADKESDKRDGPNLPDVKEADNKSQDEGKIYEL